MCCMNWDRRGLLFQSLSNLDIAIFSQRFSYCYSTAASHRNYLPHSLYSTGSKCPTADYVYIPVKINWWRIRLPELLSGQTSQTSSHVSYVAI